VQHVLCPENQIPFSSSARVAQMVYLPKPSIASAPHQLCSIRVEDLASHVFSTLLFVVLVRHVSSVISLSDRQVEFVFESGWQIQFIFIGEGLVPIHPDFSGQFCSFAKLIFHLIGDSALSTLGWVRIFFGDCESSYSEYNFARWVCNSSSVKLVGVR
jgi:hypothetical protein